MIVLVDTNILCRLCNSTKPATVDAAAARRALQVLRSQGHTLAIASQNIYEFWCTATRAPGNPPSGANGLGMTIDRAVAWVDYFLRAFRTLPESDRLLEAWGNLVRTLGISGYRSYDARLVAAMGVHGISHLLTFNLQDFRRFNNILLLDPKSF